MIRPEYQAEIDRARERLIKALEWERGRQMAMYDWKRWRSAALDALKAVAVLLEGVE